MLSAYLERLEITGDRYLINMPQLYPKCLLLPVLLNHYKIAAFIISVLFRFLCSFNRHRVPARSRLRDIIAGFT